MLEKILKQYGADKVSARTKISKKNLSKLLEKDFEGFSKPQAYGFVSILQREYGDDFAELKAELDVWFSASEGEDRKEEIFISADKGGSASGYKKGAIAAVLLLAVAAALFYLFQKGESGGVKPQEAAKSRAAAPVDENLTPMAVSAAAVEEKAQSPRSAERSDESVKEGVKRGGEAKEQESVTAKKEQKETEPYVPMESAVITPVVKLWFGVIDLESKKRVAKTTADPYEIDPKGRKLLITGHGRFEISDSFGNLFKYNDAKKHYFLIDDGMVKEISLSEFRRLNGGKVW